MYLAWMALPTQEWIENAKPFTVDSTVQDETKTES